MITVAFVTGGAILLVALIGLVYMASQRSKGDETGRRTQVNKGPATPKRTEGREA